MAGSAQAQTGAQGQVSYTLNGEIENMHINNLSDPWSGGWMRVGGQDFILPRNLLIDLPANRLTLQQMYLSAPPACVARGESGLARTDACLQGRSGAYTTNMLANRLSSGEIIVGEIWIDKGLESLNGVVSYINYDDGYFRIGGQGAAGGTMVRINDPGSRHTIQKGLGCAGWFDNCSADPRFTIDDENYMVAATTGYPMCIPSTVGASAVVGGIRNTASSSTGVGDPFCPSTNRTGLTVANSTRFAPIVVGDHVLVEGNFEIVNGQRFLSAWHVQVHQALVTRNTPDQPDYMIWDEVSWDAPGFNNGRTRMLMIGFTTLAASQLDVYALRIDPSTGLQYEDPIASTVGNPDSTVGVGFAGRGSIFKFQYDVDFLTVTKQEVRRPCPVLTNAGFTKCQSVTNSAEDFSVLSPISREIIGRSRRTLNPGVVARDINGVVANSGQYLTPIGVNHPEFAEIDLNALQTPKIFEGEPWNWDRRLSPGGCLETGCDSTAQALDPFPQSGLDGRDVLSGGSAGPPVPNRIFTYFTPTGRLITHPNGLQTPELLAHLLDGYPGSVTPAPGSIPGPAPFPPAGGGGTALVGVPSVMGLSEAAASAAVTSAGLAPTASSANAATPAGQVFTQVPAPGDLVAPNSAVSFVVSLGPANVVAPGVVGATQTAAQSAITSAGLTLGAVTSANSPTVAAGLVISQNPPSGSSLPPGSSVALVMSLGPANVTAPSVVGATQAAAQSAITSAGLTLGAVTSANSGTVGAGLVISQSPTSGSSLPPGSAVALVMSLGPANVAVPNIGGLTQAAAQGAITGASLTVGAISNANNATVAAGLVISQNPASGSSVAPGTAVAFVVSLGPAPIIVPNVVNLTQAAAQSAITGAGLAVGAITNANSATVAAGSVISSAPAAGAGVASGSAVAIVVSLGPAAGSPTAQVSVFSDGTGARTTPAFSTTTPGEVLVALVGSDGPTTGVNNQNITVSGAGLTWTRVQRAATSRGVSEIWTATAPTVLTNVTVTSTQSVTVVLGGPVNQSLTVIAFTNASGIGATTAASGTSVNATASLVTQAAGSAVYGVGNDFDRAIVRTAGAGQTKIHEFLAPTGDTFWMQSLNAATAAAGSTVILNATVPAPADQWNFAIVEVKR